MRSEVKCDLNERWQSSVPCDGNGLAEKQGDSRNLWEMKSQDFRE